MWKSYNASCSGEMQKTPLYVFLYVCAAGVVLLTVCGNMLVIISISHFKELHTPTNFFVFSLALADLLIGVMVMPFAFSVFIETNWVFSKAFCLSSSVTAFSLTCVSIYNVAFIAVDRFLVLSDPFFYSSKITVNLTLCVIFSIWFFSFIYNAFLVLFNKNDIKVSVVNNNSVEENLHCPVKCSVEINYSSAFVDLILVFIFPCCTMIFLYIRIFALVNVHANAIRSTAKKEYLMDSRKRKLSMASERKAAKTLGILVGVFVLCMIPSCRNKTQ
ncbi:trace amine-associated receptor 13c-like [Scleropages formosus]|uniref:trace amine-associated receptor 13c-like n=1 Tax=Scleropages formosus TaxID=113540 RepID=UPI0010FA661C|nr:trace amine-associated receptor 13c-like [Scleropages formosus]